MNAPKKKFDRAVAIAAAKNIVDCIKPFCERLLVCGSLRRRKLKVGDVELVYIPKFKEEKIDLLSTAQVNQVDKMLKLMISEGVIAKRKNVNGSEVWGEKNKLAVHVKTGVPVDFFSTTPEAWWNYIVCRTGGAQNNTLIAQAYQRKKCRWNPYSAGFTTSDGIELPNPTEESVYQNAGLRYLQPWERP